MTDRRTQGVMLLAVGAAAVWLGFSDVTLSFVRAGVRPLLAAGGAVLLALGLAAVVRRGSGGAGGGAGETGDPGDPGGDPGGHGHQGDRGPPIAWLLALPLLVLALVEPPALGSYAASRQAPAAAMSGGGGAFPPVSPEVGGAVPMELSEFSARALYDERHSLAGVRVRLIGFVTPGHQGGGSYLLSRFAMFCCAADAQVMQVAVRGDGTARAADQWLLVEGRWQPQPKAKRGGDGDEAVPALVADSVTPVAPPRDRYEHSLFG